MYKISCVILLIVFGLVVSSVENCNIDRFLNMFASDLLPFDERIFQKWSDLTILEKLPYLLSSVEIDVLKREYVTIISKKLIGQSDFECIAAHLDEFRSPGEIIDFIESCDLDRNNELCFQEYVLCRGDFDLLGRRNDKNEYEMRESVLFYDYENSLRSSKKLPHLKYDENGIIID